MNQVIENVNIKCDSCGQQHDSQLVAFEKTLVYKNQKVKVPEFFHTCLVNKVYYQTDKDVVQTWIYEQRAKKTLEQQSQQWTINFR